MGGLYVPLFGDFEAINRTAATDHMTLTAAASATGDHIVCQNSSGTEEFVVAAGGGVTIAAGGLTLTAGDLTVTAGDVQITKGYFLRFSAFYTTAVPTTGLTLGDAFLCQESTAVQLAVCTDSTQNTLTYFTAETATFGRGTTG
jgi:hypothetical protein